MNPKYLRRKRLRLLTLPLTALLLAATAATAHADYISFSEFVSDHRSVDAQPGELVNRSARLALIPDANNHVKAGTTFTLQPLALANATIPPITFTSRTPWPDSDNANRPSTTVNIGLRAPDKLGEAIFNVSWATAGAPCAFGTTCLRTGVSPAGPPIRYTLNVTPRPVTNLDVDASAGTQADFSWTPSADDHRITRYYVWRYRKDTNSEHREWFVAPGTSSVQDTDLEPGVEYCWNVATTYVDPTTGKGFTGWREAHCETTNAAPSAPGPVSGPEFDRDDRFPVSWEAASDPDGDAVTYEVERRDANDASWLPVANGLTSPTADVTPDPRAGSFPSGTWSFRVRAVTANGLTSPWTETNAVTKVDPFPPSQPRSTQEPAAPNEFGWYKDPVTVTFGGSTDGNLADGSSGSGVASYTDPITLTEDGHQRAEGRATDRAGNESFPWSINAPIDRTKPTANIECPTQAIVKGSGWNARWTATDATSGVQQAVGFINLDRPTTGTYTVTSPEPVDGAGNVGEADTCTYVVHEAPTKPGVPVVPEFDDDGDFEVTWDPSTDAEDDAITYEFILKDADSNFAHAPGGTSLSQPAYRVEDLADGTWEFVVRPTDSRGAVGPLAFAAVKTKVDRVAPSAPTAATDPAEPVHEGWFRDSVTVSFGGSEDPVLLDKSPGSGIAGYSGGRTFDTTGQHTATGAASDRAGNRSAETSRSVKVDATAPTVEITCPTGPVLVGSTGGAAWTAGDEGSGLATPAEGSEPLDTSSAGHKTVTAPAPRDNVGHEGQTDSCEYDVNTRPTDPGAPAGPEFDRDGTFDLSWAASHDADGDKVTYAVERRESGEGKAWEPLADGLTAAELRETDTPEGTYDYRVQASDPHGAVSGWVDSLDPVKVDGTAPSAPAATTDPAAPAEGAGGWFKDRVSVAFGGSNDPDLPDTSAGSGVASYSGGASFDTSGTHTATGFATDKAGNESDRTEQTVKVDATAPALDTDGCPTAPLLEGTRRVVRWTASDAHSGLATGESGELTLDTAEPGDDQVAELPTARDRVGYETTARCEFDVYANTAPGAPGAPEGPALDQDGAFGLTWGKASDRDVDAGDSITYELQRQDANDGDWTPVADGLSATERQVDVEDGTWTFRVRAVDSFAATSDWAVSQPVKVDGAKPTAPTATADPAAPAADADGWYQDRVSVSFGGSEDPALADTSAGSGVTSYSGDESFDTTGTHTATGFATDRAGNESDRTEHTVKVDADKPAPEIACPSGTLIVGQPATAAWTATDKGSGLATPASGQVTLDTSTPGAKTATAPAARDIAGHQTEGPSCDYDVAYKFAGFNAPINGSVVNAGKAGRTYPVKWRLQLFGGSLITDSAAQALLPTMSVVTKATDCGSFGSLPEDVLEESTTADPSLKYDTSDNQYHYNYKAPSTPGCYVLVVRNADGHSTRWVNFKLTR